MRVIASDVGNDIKTCSLSTVLPHGHNWQQAKRFQMIHVLLKFFVNSVIALILCTAPDF